MQAASPEPAESAETGLHLATSDGRWVLLATVLGSSLALLDSTVVNVALPRIGSDLHVGVDGLQWILTGYLLTLASFILLGGSLGDRYGRRTIFVIGTAMFAIASLLCGVAPDLPLLVGARMLQGIGGALLTPGSLAIIQASFREADRGPAIGAWSGLGGVAAAIGPLLGGWLVQTASWRWIFLLNLPLAVAVIVVSLRHVPETADPRQKGRGNDVLGAILAVACLAGTTFALVEGPVLGATNPLILGSGVGGLLLVALFVVRELRTSAPMLPLDIFLCRQFTGANLATLAVYAALSGVLFLLVLELQQVLGYTPIQSGLATIPITLIMLSLSARAGALAQRIGPRRPMSVGPLLIGLGVWLLARIGPGSSYLTDVLPALLVFAFGLATTVAPLTATVLAAVDARHAGIASAVNNAVARLAGLLAVALLPLLAGLSSQTTSDPDAFTAGFRVAMRLAAGLAASGGVLAWLLVRDEYKIGASDSHCAIDGPPLR